MPIVIQLGNVFSSDCQCVRCLPWALNVFALIYNVYLLRCCTDCVKKESFYENRTVLRVFNNSWTKVEEFPCVNCIYTPTRTPKVVFAIGRFKAVVLTFFIFVWIWNSLLRETSTFEPRHDKTNKVTATSEDSDQPGHPPSLIRVFAVHMKKAWVFSYPLSAQRDPDQTGRMPRLIWVFAGCTVTLLVLSCRGSFISSLIHCSQL